MVDVTKSGVRRIRGSGDAALQMVKTPSGEFTANIPEMYEAIRAVWEPVNRRYEATPEPSVDKFMSEYRQHIRRSAMKARVLKKSIPLAKIGALSISYIQFSTFFCGFLRIFWHVWHIYLMSI